MWITNPIIAQLHPRLEGWETLRSCWTIRLSSGLETKRGSVLAGAAAQPSNTTGSGQACLLLKLGFHRRKGMTCLMHHTDIEKA